MGTIPHSANTGNWFILTRSIGLDHQVIMRLKRPTTAMLARSTTPNFTAIQRIRVTLSVHSPSGCGAQDCDVGVRVRSGPG